jgi:hypothetical protein
VRIASDEISARSQSLISQSHDRRGAQRLAGTRGTWKWLHLGLFGRANDSPENMIDRF